MEEYTYDYINGTDIYLYQHKKMFRINTDTALLARFMTVKKGERVLDIGTNNGALLLAAQRYEPKHMYGVDIQKEAIQVADMNMRHHNITNVTLLAASIHEAQLEKMDVIVCNPPYFKVHDTSNLNESQSLQMARHERFLTLDTLCRRVQELLDEKGRFYMVHRASRIAEIAYTLKQHRLEIRTLQFVYDVNKEEAVSVLVEAVKDGKVNAHVLPPQMIKR
ncbi:methyltransferase domain-containing protein [[Clostridium] innocuum]|nr:methyltransferase domain-containing protein [[Clostridium] innocuum]